MPCSYWAYIDATAAPARVRLETTCSLYGPPVASLTGYWLLEPRGGKAGFEYTLAPEGLGRMAETPCTPLLLPQPWPPYTTADIELVVDTRPGLLIYGLPSRRSTVLTATQRTLLEGSGAVLQAVAVSENAAVGSEEAVVDGWLILATLPPLRSSLPDLEEARLCALARPGLEGWGRCLWTRGRGYSERLLADAPSHAWARACLYARLYAGSLAEAGLDPLYWARRVRAETGPWAPLSRRGRVLRVEAEKARGALARREGGDLVVRETSLHKGVYGLEGWDAAGLACRSCLEPLR